MRIDEPIAFERYGSRVALLLGTTLATRYTAEANLAAALPGFAFWGGAFFACWQLRRALHASPSGALTPQRAGEGVAGLGMLLFLATLIDDGMLPSLVALLFALTAALLVIAERRAHVLLMLGTSLAPVLFAASQSRSSWFVPCAAAFTLAVLSLLAFDIGCARSRAALAVPLTPRRAGHGAAVVALGVLVLALPLYLFVPQPPALSLGGRSAQSTQDYSEPEPNPRADESRGTRERDESRATQSRPARNGTHESDRTRAPATADAQAA